MIPYYSDDLVTLYHGDCLDNDEWLTADVLVTDPPFGRSWQQGKGLRDGNGGWARSKIKHDGIRGDSGTKTRDDALTKWGTEKRPAIVFGDPLIAQPADAVQALAYLKPSDAGIRGARGGYRRDLEMIYLVGPWPSGIGGRTSVLRTGGLVAGPRGIATRAGHPHAKPIDVLESLIMHCPPGVVADPFAGSGSTLVAAVNQGRRAVGVEVEERYCEIIANRLQQQTLTFG
ncbi:methyltransferase [Gordonia phage Verity]|uniref:Methyltransferase n=2 Tax=Zitchvirus TaxID=2948963 RepID=A0A514DIZ8_9CAUD|nr:methyltransferase [Gordonia phage Zipp]YP_010002926.1 methyltransferase [Gordonia phage Verity]QPO16932.1 methyltransferase [Gordonia phage Delrey21]QXN74215.1 DNA methylase [Gordonia phage DoctorFroggo]QDH93242.1 methyltransferase [Gordonia phage Zipp]QDH93574.1 methyltransferase [Gordonia phage Verity]